VSSNGPFPGWYPDPWMPNGVRWWDGGNWTGYTAWARHPAIPQERKERSLLTWAKAFPIAFGIVTVVAAAFGGSAISSIHHYFHEYDHWLKVSTSANGNGHPVPSPPSFPFKGAVLVVDLAQIPVEGLMVVFYVWIYRAASAARSLGYPAPWSPGWSVAVWLIPVVSFWMPAQALRSLLPSGHPARDRVWAGWLLYPATLVLDWVGLGWALFGSGGAVSWTLIGCGGVTALTASYLLFRYIGSVGAQHRRAVEALL
jgi:hypothetical protein